MDRRQLLQGLKSIGGRLTQTPTVIKATDVATTPQHESLSDFIERFLFAQDVRENSRTTYRSSLGQFIDWIDQAGIRGPDRDDVLAYKRSLGELRLSPMTISSYLVAVRKFFEWTESMKLYPNIARGVKGPKAPKGFRKDALTIEQTRSLLNSTDTKTNVSKRDFAILNLLVRTGLRTIELVRANLGDIRRQGGEAVLWIQGKGRDAKDDFVLLTEETLPPIRTYLSTRKGAQDEEPLFASASNRNRRQRLTTRTIRAIVKRSLIQIGLDSDRLTAHSLRHTAITLSLHGGASIQEAQALGRHADINTTLIYAHNINRVANAPERMVDEALRCSEKA